MPGTGPFRFCTERRLVRLTGRRARTLAELGRHIEDVSGASIFYHTHHRSLAYHVVTPFFFNDFADWALGALQERELGERLAAIDLLRFQSLGSLREAILDVIAGAADAQERAERPCTPGDEFHFCESHSFVVRTGLEAGAVSEFFDVLPRISGDSLYYHFFLARLRLDQPSNDFSQWLASQGAADLAAAIDRIDPCGLTLDELKARIAAVGQAAFGAGHGSPTGQL